MRALSAHDSGFCNCNPATGHPPDTIIDEVGRLVCSSCFLPERQIRAFFTFMTDAIWIGAHWDRTSRTLYVQPLPCLGAAFKL